MNYQHYFFIGFNYEDYKLKMANDLENNPTKKYNEFIKLNQHRMARVEKKYEVSLEITEAIKKLSTKVYWLVITENWCGDSSQITPALHKIAELSEGKIELRFIYRDEHQDLINAHLTNNGQSIPKLIQLDENFNVLKTWGPRPKEAQTLVQKLKANPATSPTYNNELHLWYARDNQSQLNIEIAHLLSQ